MRPPAKLARSLLFLPLLFQQQREKVSSESARRRRRGAGGRAGGQESKAYRPTAARHLTSSCPHGRGRGWLSLCQCYQSQFMCAYTDTCLHLPFHHLICCQMSATSLKPWYTVRLDRRRWKGRRGSALKGRASKTTARSGCQIRTFPSSSLSPLSPRRQPTEWSPISFLNNDNDAVLISKVLLS